MKLADPFAGRCFFYVKECPFKEECRRAYNAPCQSWGWTTEECRQRVLKHLKQSGKHLKNCPPGNDRHVEYQMATQAMDVFCDVNGEPGSGSGLDPRNTDGETGMDVHATGQAAIAKAAPESTAGAAVPKAAPHPWAGTDQEAIARSKTTRMLAHEEMSKFLPKDVEEGVIDEETLAQEEEAFAHSSRMRVRRPGWSRSRSRSLRSRSYRSPSHSNRKGESKGGSKWEKALKVSIKSFYFDKKWARIDVENARERALRSEAMEVVSKVSNLLADIGRITCHMNFDQLPLLLLTRIQYAFLMLHDFKSEANARIAEDDDSPLPFSLKDVEETCVTGTRDHLPSKSSWAGGGSTRPPIPLSEKKPLSPSPPSPIRTNLVRNTTRTDSGRMGWGQGGRGCKME